MCQNTSLTKSLVFCGDHNANTCISWVFVFRVLGCSLWRHGVCVYRLGVQSLEAWDLSLETWGAVFKRHVCVCGYPFSPEGGLTLFKEHWASK